MRDFRYDSGTVKTLKPEPEAPRVGRYTMERAAAEVHRVIQSRERGTHSRIAEELGMSSQQLTHRCSSDYDFTLVELGIIADFLHAPTGWPFVPWKEGEERDDAWKKRNRR
jgi:hypothetical protein